MHLKEGILLQGGKYRIVRFISSGGFGCTYEAEHVMFRKRVAIKEFFVKDFCGRDENTALVTVETTNKRGLIEKMKLKFIDEARSLFDLHHQGIVRVTDIFEENHTAYYVMDYIDGKSLKEIVDKEGALSEVRALGYIRQVADALGYVHAHNRLHLDIKPGNIMIDGNDHAILIDFGTSKQYDEVNGENTSTLLGHTPGYAPPEQIGNDLVKFTPTTDIYALGATLYKLLSGITPTSSNLRISGEKLEPLSGSISVPTRNTVERAMKVNRYDRPDSVDAFLLLLDAPVGDDEEETVPEVVSPALSVPQLNPNLPKWLILIAFCSLTALCILGLRKCPGHNGGGSEDYDSLCSLVHVDSISVDSIVVDELTLQENHTFSVADKTTPSVTEENKKVDVTVACQLYVTTSPVGVLVYVDGKKIGKTPIEGMDISRGKHTVKLVLEGYDTFTKKYSFGEKPVVINETLVAKVGNVVPNPTFKNESPSQPPLEEGAKVGTINGHVYVDLGLSVKWATMNVGARSPGDYGDYFSWGEIHPKSEYTEQNNLTWEKDMGNICGNFAYDAARYHWGGSWRLPTVTEIQELNVKCTWTWTIQDGHNGYEVVGPNGNRIFLPASGISMQSSVQAVGTGGYYWSSLPYENDDSRYAYFMFLTGNVHRVGWGYRCWGQNVRPVAD